MGSKKLPNYYSKGDPAARRNFAPASMAIIAGAGWFALSLQVTLLVRNALLQHTSVLAAVESYFSYFTILTNLLVAFTLTIALLTKDFWLRSWASAPKTQTAFAIYISVVGLVYSVVLRATWNPQGWQKFADILLHDFVPAAYFLFWLRFVPKSALKWRDAVAWLVYPLTYLFFLLFRGAIVGRYPYPFIDLNELSYLTFCRNAFLLFGLFLLLGILFVAIGRLPKLGGRSRVKRFPPERMSRG